MAHENTVFLDAEDLTDEHIAEAKGDKPNVIVGIGFLGGMTLFLNPKDAKSIIERYEIMKEDKIGDLGYMARIVGFDDVFDAYDFGENND